MKLDETQITHENKVMVNSFFVVTQKSRWRIRGHYKLILEQNKSMLVTIEFLYRGSPP